MWTVSTRVEYDRHGRRYANDLTAAEYGLVAPLLPTRSGAFLARFSGIAGDRLKRPPSGFDPDHPCIEDLKRKSYYATQRVDPALARTPEFIEEVGDAFTALTPFMKFLTSALDLPCSPGS